MDQFLQIINTVGIPVGILVAFSIAIWRSLIWLAENVAKPVTIKHIEFIEEVKATIMAVADVVKDVRNNQDKIITKIDDVSKDVKELKNR